MKLKLIILAGLFACGFAFSANAGSVTDTDSDLVPDGFDNCSTLANGPGEASNQVDTDQDGFGNRCDPDFDQDGQVLTSDFSGFLSVFPGAATGADEIYDLDGDQQALTSDFSIFLGFFPGGTPGPSGLGCADATIDVGSGDTPCTP